MKHRIWHHKNEFPQFKYNCKDCAYATNELTNFRNHANVHDSSRSFSCDICGNRFRALNSLNNHILIHNGEKVHSFRVVNKEYRFEINYPLI